MQIARRILFVLLAVVAWILADLWLGRDLLPWAPQLEHLAFRSVVAPLEWLTEGSGIRLQIALGIGVVLGVLGVGLRRTLLGRGLGQLAAALGAGGLVFVAVLGLLMERALAGGILFALLVRVVTGERIGAPSLASRAAPLDATGRRALVGVLVITGGGALYWLYSVFMTFGEGYALLRWLGGLLRDGGAPFLGAWAAVVGLAVVGSAVTLRSLTSSHAAVGLSIVPGILAAVVLRSLFETHGPWWTALLVVPFA
ncbi:MAG: hypothetical protein KDA24_27915, partial [Deltaproteobacteria bacterium]|nr:hypothetical protein [Deltaproteobacteria bacterium]